MVSSMTLSLVVVILSLATTIPLVDADSSMIQNLRSVYYQTTAAESVTAPAPAPSIRILQDGDPNRQGQDNVPHLSPTAETVTASASTPCSIRILPDGDPNGQGEGNVPSSTLSSSVIAEYWATIEGDGYGKSPDGDVATDQEEKVVGEDLPLSVVATTTDKRNLNDSEGSQAEADSSANDQDNDNDSSKSSDKNSVKDDTKWVILVAVLGGASFLLMIFMLVLVCRTLGRNRREHSAKEVEGRENATAATAANHDATYDASETDLSYSEHPDIHEIYTDSDNASEASFV
jgi:hypothetical protein